MRSKIRMTFVLLGLTAALCIACGDDGSWSDLLLSTRHSVRGTLTKLDRERHEIVVRNRKGIDVAVETDSASRIPAAAAEGAQVSVRYNLKNGKKVATVVKVFGARVPAP